MVGVALRSFGLPFLAVMAIVGVLQYMNVIGLNLARYPDGKLIAGLARQAAWLLDQWSMTVHALCARLLVPAAAQVAEALPLPILLTSALVALGLFALRRR